MTSAESGEDTFDDKSLLRRKLFVGNISFRITREELSQFFSKFGEVVKAIVVKDHTRKRSRGIGFITFSSPDEVDKVLSLDPSELVLDERQLRVNRAEHSKRKTFKPPRKHLFGDADEGMHAGKVESAEILESKETEEDRNDEEPERRLTDDCLLLIFTYLEANDRIRIERVCKRWQCLALQSWSSVRHLQFQNIFKLFRGLTDQNLRCIFERGCTNLTSLDLSGSARFLTEHSLELVAHYCRGLKRINLTNVAATDHSLRTLAEGCPKLEKFSMRNSHYAGEKGLWWIFHLCPSLQFVDLEGNLRLSGQCFHMFGKNLKVLKLNDCRQLQDVGIQKLSEKCPQLERLEVKDCHKLGAEALNYLGQGLQNLKILDFSGPFPKISDSGSLLNISKLSLLTDLRLFRNGHVTDSFLEQIAEKCSNLLSLDISCCHEKLTNSGIQTLSQCYRLTSLNISYIPIVSDETVLLLGSTGILENLTMRACSNVSDKGAIELVATCGSLTSLDMSGCLQISPKCLQGIVDVTKTRGQSSTLQLYFGGTSILSVEDQLPDFITVDLFDLHDPNLRPDMELGLSLGIDDGVGFLVDDMNGLMTFDADYGDDSNYDYLADYVPVSLEEDAQMFLDFEDPLMEEELMWS